jgi:hypothetical protein
MIDITEFFLSNIDIIDRCHRVFSFNFTKELLCKMLLIVSAYAIELSVSVPDPDYPDSIRSVDPDLESGSGSRRAKITKIEKI